MSLFSCKGVQLPLQAGQSPACVLQRERQARGPLSA